MTRASATPVRRVVLGARGDMVIEVTDRMIALRPKGARRGGPAEVTVTHEQLYLRTMMHMADEKRREKARLKKERARSKRR